MNFDVMLRIAIQSLILGFTPIMIGTNINGFLKAKTKLQKVNRRDKNIIIEKNFIETTNDFTKNVRMLRPLLKKLKEYTKEENLKTIYRNLNTATVKKDLSAILCGALGTYDGYKNEISFISISKYSLSHEFLHMASSYYNKENGQYLSGFSQSHNNITIGTGMNEGYTELLNSRIFGNKITSYKDEANILQLIELFFDNPKDLEDYYFNHDLMGLIKKLEVFSSREEIIKLILDIDTLNILSNKAATQFVNLMKIKIKLKLYNMFIKTNNSLEKDRQFKEIMKTDKMFVLLLNKPKFKLYKDNLLNFLETKNHKK